ncbi:Panacea domain-containing protein [Phascolarctobacterium succinatutens]|uniref:Panacea domain-containing protein n=1 Tax=Phascolarctobacterium succinatutens TaxID=626940 RepID=UPI0026ED102B|nr:type II toxin-antitoxin system antitoxin SocA domain-containing protein [Phascolarctobacterium succinatutens]
MYDALEIAKYIISKCFKEGVPVTNLRLQKLLYFIQVESYKVYGKQLFNNDIAAWQFGPVVPDVYYKYSVYAGMPILLQYNNLNLCNKVTNIVDDVIEKNKNIPIWKLVEITHKPDGPWDITINKFGLRSIINSDLIAEEAKLS